ncbi:MAG: oligosaccharide flippase family protein [Desulforegulaceae bacterium]|nr:oligosaccharide flippase family protein [Desulforegulaceae bacterium]
MLKEFKELIKHSAIYGSANFLKKGIGFLMIPVYTRFLTPADYGVLELLDLTLEIVGMIVGMRLGGALIRYYHNYDSKEDKEAVFTTALIFSAILSIFLLCVLQLFSKNISFLVTGTDEYLLSFQMVFICFAIQNIYLISETYLIVQKKSVLYSFLSTMTLVLSLSLNILFVVFMGMKVYGILLSMLITKSINAVIVVPVTLKGVRLRFSIKKLLEMVKYALPLIPASLSMFVIHFSDRFFIQKYCELNELGLYSLGYKFGMMISVLISQPIFRIWDTQRYEIAKKENGKEIFSKVFTYYNFFVVSVGLVISVYIREIIFIIASDSFQGGSEVVPLIVLSYIFFGISSFVSFGILYRYQTKYIALIQLIVAGVNIIANIFFIKNYGVIGAGISTLITFFTLSLLTYFFAQKLYYIKFEYFKFFILFFTAVSFFLIANSIDESLVVSIIIKTFLLILYLVVLFVFKFFTMEEIRQVKRMFFSKN